LSRRLGQRVLLKREDQQAVFSFKLRGAYNRMVQLDAVERTIHTMWSMAFGMTISRETWGPILASRSKS
jgi:hypothetical protein